MIPLRHLATAFLIAGVCMVGCGKKATPPEKAPAEPDKPAIQDPPADPEPGKATASSGKGNRLHQAMAEATRNSFDPPAGSSRPPDCLKSGTPTFKILDAVVASWESIRFTTATGKKIIYTADIQTSEGTIRIALLPEQSPNHVRNFIALARAGYYDGLSFERMREESADSGKFEAVEAGCPEGQGEPGMGSIGYWLKDELTPGSVLTHDEGVVGACRWESEDSSACRFYISLSKAPSLDGGHTLFGKVTQGLDVARKMFKGPTASEDSDRKLSRRFAKPATIHKVTIQQQEH